MNIIDVLNYSGSLFLLVKEVQKIVYRKSQKNKIYNSLKSSLDSSTKAYDSMIYSLYGLLGANIFASQIMPYNYEIIGKGFANDFIESYNNLISEIENLVVHLKSHENSIKEISGKEWIKYETIFHAFEKETDWKYLYEEFSKEKISQPKRKDVSKFINVIYDEIKPVTSQFDKKWFGDIDEFVKIAQDPKTVKKIKKIIFEENQKKYSGR